VKNVSTIACIAAALVPSVLRAAEGELVARPLGSTDAPYGHLEYVPPGYAEDGVKHPVVLFLHGVGESGDGVTNLEGPMKAHGPGKLIDQGSTYFAEQGALVFMPQTPVWWDANTIHAFLGYIAANFRVDPRRGRAGRGEVGHLESWVASQYLEQFESGVARGAEDGDGDSKVLG